MRMKSSSAAKAIFLGDENEIESDAKSDLNPSCSKLFSKEWPASSREQTRQKSFDFELQKTGGHNN